MIQDAAPIRLGCIYCERDDFDNINSLPDNWEDIKQVRSLEDACREVPPDDHERSVFKWETHIGICPECVAWLDV